MKNLIQQIHILKNKLGLSDEIYRAVLQETYQVTSSKDLNISQQKELIYLLNSQVQDVRASLTLLHRTCKDKVQFISSQKKNQLSLKQQNYILFLSKDKITNLPAYCSKITQRSITNIKELSKSEAIKVINSLQRYYKEKSDKGATLPEGGLLP